MWKYIFLNSAFRQVFVICYLHFNKNLCLIFNIFVIILTASIRYKFYLGCLLFIEISLQRPCVRVTRPSNSNMCTFVIYLYFLWFILIYLGVFSTFSLFFYDYWIDICCPSSLCQSYLYLSWIFQVHTFQFRLSWRNGITLFTTIVRRSFFLSLFFLLSPVILAGCFYCIRVFCRKLITNGENIFTCTPLPLLHIPKYTQTYPRHIHKRIMLEKNFK